MTGGILAQQRHAGAAKRGTGIMAAHALPEPAEIMDSTYTNERIMSAKHLRCHPTPPPSQTQQPAAKEQKRARFRSRSKAELNFRNLSGPGT